MSFAGILQKGFGVDSKKKGVMLVSAYSSYLAS